MTITLQRCDACGTPNYPRRALCRSCLADALVDTADPGTGTLLAATVLHRSFEPAHADALPMRIGTVRLDSGPHLLAFLAGDLTGGDRAVVTEARDGPGQRVYTAERG